MRYIFDWCPKYSRAILKSENLEEVRMAFSETKYSRNRRFNRDFAITNSGRFLPGLFIEILKYIKNNDVTANIIVTPQLKEKISCGFDFYDKPLIQLENDFRDYQEDVIRKAIKQGYGNIVVATAGGKTMIMAGLIGSILQFNPDYKVLVALPPQLVGQTYQDFLSYGIPSHKVGRWDGDNTYSPENNIIIASTSILLSKKQDTDWIKDVDMLLGDEAHRNKKGNGITKLLEKVKTPHKYGFTGTLPDKKIDEWKVLGLFGPVIYEKPGHELRKEGYIADAIVKILHITYKIEPDIDYSQAKVNPTAAYRQEMDFIIKSNARNNIIAKISSKINKNILILVDRIEHGDIIKEYLTNNTTDKRIYFIQGSVDKDERERIKMIMEKYDNVVCIAMSAIFSTGINIKNLHYVLFGAGGKAKTRIIQSIGRGLRLHPSKTKLVIFDITDNLKYGQRHHEKRLVLYENEKLDYHVKTITT